MLRFFSVLSLTIIILCVGAFFLKRHYVEGNRAHLAQFTLDATTGSYREARPLSFFGQPKPFKRVVLLLTGFNSTPQEFEFLAKALEQENIYFYAPRFLGNGLESSHLFEVVNETDWLRETFEAYALVDSLADRIDVVAHSTGANLALHLAQTKKIHNLILTGPNVYLGKDYTFYLPLLNHHLAFQIYNQLITYYPKPIRKGRDFPVDTLDVSRAHKTVTNINMSVQSIKSLFNFSHNQEFTSLNVDNLYLLFGEKDLTVELDPTLQKFQGFKYQVKKYPHSAHNILEDYDKEEVIQDVITILQQDVS